MKIIAKSDCCFKSCPREGASEIAPSADMPRCVSSHAPVRGHLLFYIRKSAFGKFQVMPPQGGIDSKGIRCVCGKVSSHAPARGHL